jgi:peptidoglycan biosynthesis protein MviN/MurJ (putative lipid II flippase)
VLIFIWFVLSTILSIPASSYLYARNLFKAQLRWTFTTAVVNFILGLILVRIIGLPGVAIATVVSSLWEQQFKIVRNACSDIGITKTDYAKKIYGKNIYSLVIMLLTLFVTQGAFTHLKIVFPWTFMLSGLIMLPLSLFTWTKSNLSTEEWLGIKHRIMQFKKTFFNRQAVPD